VEPPVHRESWQYVWLYLYCTHWFRRFNSKSKSWWTRSTWIWTFGPFNFAR